ncbi:hypothetical protein [Ferrimonas sp.]|uniref:hypothetical protein n=1 Tax=Ferrimonas sp. TaxID=2080861 RepID=UPI003A8DB783
MFRLMSEPAVKGWPCTIDVPADGGQMVETHITLDFRLPPAEEHDQLLGLGNDRQFLTKVIQGWGNIGGADGEPLPFSQDNLNAVLDQPFFCIGALAAFKDAYSGAALKNSMKREVTGVAALAKTPEE